MGDSSNPNLGNRDEMAAVATRARGQSTTPAPARTPRQTDRRSRTGRMRDQLRSPWLWLVTFAVWLGVVLLEQILLPHPVDRLSISYTYFKQQVAAGNVVDVNAWADTVQGDFRSPVPEVVPPGVTPRTFEKFSTNVPSFADHAQLDQLLEGHGVTINVQPLETPRSPLFEFLVAFGPTFLFIGGFLWLSKRGMRGGGLFGMGRSRARRYEAGDGTEAITFADVAGIDEVESELVQIVDFLKQPDKYQRLGGRMPKGVLLAGPPGTGKTLLARAMAGEAGVPFFSMSGSEFVEMVVGVGASRVRDLFAQAKKAAPAIIFVDEIDAIGRRRGGGGYGSNEEREQTLNQLLVEMDGFDARAAVVVVAASNRPDVLDAALLRPGRFDRRVTVLPPDRVGRKEILEVHVRGVPLAPDVDLGAVAAQTPGLVGADLRNLVNEAALLAARRGKDRVGASEFSESVEKIALGAERRLTLSPQERRRVAFHEAGHALLGFLQPEADPPRRVTVIPRGQALGVTLSVPDDDRYNYGEDYLRARITCALGGRAAEQLVYGVVTTGAENDLKQVTDLARAMVTRWGMSPEVGLLALGGPADGDFLTAGLAGGPTRAYGDELSRAVDAAIRRIVEECYKRALDLLTRERRRLDSLADALLREESLDEERMRTVIEVPVAVSNGAAAR